MRAIWSVSARTDLDRLHDFLSQRDLDLADVTLDHLIAGAGKLLDFPRRGERLSRFTMNAVHEFRVGRYILRYEIGADELRVLRCFHVRERRP